MYIIILLLLQDINQLLHHHHRHHYRHHHRHHYRHHHRHHYRHHHQYHHRHHHDHHRHYTITVGITINSPSPPLDNAYTTYLDWLIYYMFARRFGMMVMTISQTLKTVTLTLMKTTINLCPCHWTSPWLWYEKPVLLWQQKVTMVLTNPQQKVTMVQTNPHDITSLCLWWNNGHKT